jgi:hypothetical protein
MRRHLLRCTSPLFGTFRKRGGFRLESGMRAKAHLGRSVRINGFTPQVSGDAVYCRNSLVSSPMPSIATVTVLTGSFADADRCAAGDQIAGQECHVMRDLADEFLGAEDHVGDVVVLTLGPALVA